MNKISILLLSVFLLCELKSHAQKQTILNTIDTKVINNPVQPMRASELNAILKSILNYPVDTLWVSGDTIRYKVAGLTRYVRFTGYLDSLNTAVKTYGVYNNPSWLNALAYSKLTGAPTALPPSGTAGGELSGSFPNPTVSYFNGQLPAYYLSRATHTGTQVQNTIVGLSDSLLDRYTKAQSDARYIKIIDTAGMLGNYAYDDLTNVTGVLSSTKGGAGSVTGIMQASGGVVTALGIGANLTYVGGILSGTSSGSGSPFSQTGSGPITSVVPGSNLSITGTIYADYLDVASNLGVIGSIIGASLSVSGSVTAGSFSASGTVNFSGLASSSDTTTYKPIVINSSGVVRKFTYWPKANISALTDTLNVTTNSLVQSIKGVVTGAGGYGVVGKSTSGGTALLGINTGGNGAALEITSDNVGMVGSATNTVINVQGGTSGGSPATTFRQNSTGIISAFQNSAGTTVASIGASGVLTATTIASVGDVFIGTITATPLGVASRSLIMQGALNSAMILSGIRTSDGNVGLVDFQNIVSGTATRLATIVGERANANNSGKMDFYIAEAGSLNLRFSIDRRGQHNMYSSVNDPTLKIDNAHASDPQGLSIRYSGATVSTTAQYYIYCADLSADRFIVKSNGGISNFQGNDSNLSDSSVKKDISAIGSYWDKFKAIKYVRFHYKDQSGERYNIGVLANQVERVAPEFVSNEGWGKPKEGQSVLKSVFTTDMYHAGLSVLKEAIIRIEALEGEVSKLKSK